MKCYCYNCERRVKKNMKPWSVFIIDEAGNEMTVTACCSECAEQIQNKYASIHENRMNKIKFKNFMPLFTADPLSNNKNK